MNKAFKILWNDARRSFVVSSEATRSHGKPSKASVAVAVALSAMMAGSSFAATLNNGFGDVVIDEVYEQVGVANGAGEWQKDSSLTVKDGGKLEITGGVNTNTVLIEGGEVSLTGSNAPAMSGFVPKASTALGGYGEFKMTGGSLELTNARVWGGAYESQDPESYKDIVLSGGEVIMNNGGITGVSGTTETGEVIGNKIVLGGADIVAKSGAMNVINGVAVEMNSGSITVDGGAILQVSTYTKDGTEFAKPYDKEQGGKFVANGGEINVDGLLNFQHMVLDGADMKISTTGSAYGDGDGWQSNGRSSFAVVSGSLTLEGEGADLQAATIGIHGGKVSLTGEGYVDSSVVPRANTNIGGYENFSMTGGEVELNTARLWIGGDDAEHVFNDMTFTGGSITLNNGGITGLSYIENGEHFGNTVLLNGTNISVKSGDKNVINSAAIEMNAGHIEVAEGATLMMSTFAKQGTDWTTEYESPSKGTVVLNGGSINAVGQLKIESDSTTINGAQITVGDLTVGQEPIVTFAATEAQAASYLGDNVTFVSGQINVLGDMIINEGASFEVVGENAALEGNGGSFVVADGATYTAYTAAVGHNIVSGFGDISIAETATIGVSDVMINDVIVDANGRVQEVEINDAATAVEGLDSDRQAADLVNAIYQAGAHVADDPSARLIAQAMQNTADVGSRAQIVNEASAIANTALVQTSNITAALNGIRSVYENANMTTKAWADVSAAADEFADADINMGGVVLGGQYAADNWMVGVSANLGKGSTHTASLINADNDFDYYGANLYGGMDFGSFRVMGQMGYTMADNDVSVTTGSESVDSSVISAGTRVQYTAQFADVAVKPYVGVEYMRVKTDAYGSLADETTQDLVMFPIGVTLSKVAQTASGWTVAPSMDIAWIPAVGDVDAETNVLGATSKTTVWGDNMVNTKFGFTAHKGNFGMGFGLNVGVGDQDRLQTGVQARIDYHF